MKIIDIKTTQDEHCPACGHTISAGSDAVQVDCRERGKGIVYHGRSCNADDLAAWRKFNR